MPERDPAAALPAPAGDGELLGLLLRLNRRLDEPALSARPILRALPSGIPAGEFLRLAAPFLDAPAEPGALPADDAWLAAERSRLERFPAFAVHWFAPDYPPLLRTIPDPPLVLYGAGRRDLLARRDAIAVVGARGCSEYGRTVTRLFASGFARAGRVVVSGLALGVDRAAHEAALEAGGDTVAVTGSGIDLPRPATNARVQREIVARGLVLTEYPFGTEPKGHHFPMRNRIIAGLARAVLVAQAALRSGSLITARLALETGREVLAVPGPVTSPLSEGGNRLLLDGATPALDPAQALAACGLAPDPAAARPRGDADAEVEVDKGSDHDKMPPRDRTILDLVRHGALSFDEIAARTGLPVREIAAAAVRLETLGFARIGAGRRLQAAP